MSTEKHKTILLLEDNPDLRAATIDLLQGLGYEVVASLDLADALETTRLKRCDLALVNAYPAKGSGLEILDRLRAERPGLPGLLASGFGDDLELRQRVLTGDVGFLTVPFSPQALEAAIEQALERRPEAARTASPVARKRARGRTGSRRFVALKPYFAAAAAVVAAGLVFHLASGPPRMPDPDPSELRRGQAIELVEPQGVLRQAPTRLIWREVPGSARYRVTLSTVDDTTIWQTETRATSVAIPASITTRLHSAVSYFWQVEGLAHDFSRTGLSTLVAFRFDVAEPISTGDSI